MQLFSLLIGEKIDDGRQMGSYEWMGSDNNNVTGPSI